MPCGDPYSRRAQISGVLALLTERLTAVDGKIVQPRVTPGRPINCRQKDCTAANRFGTHYKTDSVHSRAAELCSVPWKKSRPTADLEVHTPWYGTVHMNTPPTWYERAVVFPPTCLSQLIRTSQVGSFFTLQDSRMTWTLMPWIPCLKQRIGAHCHVHSRSQRLTGAIPHEFPFSRPMNLSGHRNSPPQYRTGSFPSCLNE
jgi:hypothetical protein